MSTESAAARLAIPTFTPRGTKNGADQQSILRGSPATSAGSGLTSRLRPSLVLRPQDGRRNCSAVVLQRIVRTRSRRVCPLHRAEMIVAPLGPSWLVAGHPGWRRWRPPWLAGTDRIYLRPRAMLLTVRTTMPQSDSP